MPSSISSTLIGVSSLLLGGLGLRDGGELLRLNKLDRLCFDMYRFAAA
jgi:hypothetical protein